VLSTRPELVGPSLADELSKLQASTPPDPPDVVRRTIEAELGRPPEDLFEEFCPEAMASASIGQVHRARLRGGRPVVVKVLHDGVEARVHRDLELMMALAELAEHHAPALLNYRPVNTIREFRRTLLRELDLAVERRNLEEFGRHFAGDPAVHIPEVYPAFCGRRVLTMEFLEGIPGPEARSAPPGAIDLGQFARRAGKMYLDMIFRDGFYHADPHPGNYVIQSGGVVGVLDCGMVGRLDDGLREEIGSLIKAVADKDAEELVERVVQLGSPPPDLDRPAFRADVVEFVADYGSRPIRELDLGAALGEVIDLISRYRIVLPSNVSLLLRTLIVLEGSAKQLDPGFSLMDLVVEYMARSPGGWLRPRRCLRDLRRAGRDYGRLLRLLPGDLADILHRLRAGTFELEHEHRHLQESIHHLVQGLLVAALLLSAAQLLGRCEGGLLGQAVPALGLACLGLAGFLGARLLRSLGGNGSRLH
jgi:ubiquinone biosynthesis protein